MNFLTTSNARFIIASTSTVAFAVLVSFLQQHSIQEVLAGAAAYAAVSVLYNGQCS
jgi:hypothetical protein